jgi:hypothetical protein
MISFGDAQARGTHSACCVTLACATPLSHEFGDLLARVALPPLAMSDIRLQEGNHVWWKRVVKSKGFRQA